MFNRLTLKIRKDGNLMRFMIKTLTLFFVLVIFTLKLATCSFAAPEIVSVQPSATIVEKLAPIFIDITISADFDNPFDPEDIKVDALITIGEEILTILPPPEAQGVFRYRGMSLTDWSRYGFYNFGPSLDKLVTTNVNYVAINVFVYQETETSSDIFFHDPRTPTDSALKSVIEAAQARGFRVVLKPNVDSQDGTWRGHFEPDDVDAWFASYTAMITHYASIAASRNVAMFSVGCEYESLSGAENRERWINVINAIREVYTGPLTYSANWTEIHTVSFWDQLDYIGISAYFPLTDDNDATADDIRQSWSSSAAAGFMGRNWIAEIDALRQEEGMDVIFLEGGASSADGAGSAPQSWTLSPVNLTLQANIYRGTIEAWADIPWFKGIFWWEWRRDPYGGGPEDATHTPMNKPAEEVMRELFAVQHSS